MKDLATEVLTAASTCAAIARGAMLRVQPGNELPPEPDESPAIRSALAAFESVVRARALHLVRADLGTLLRLRHRQAQLEEAIQALTDGERIALMEEQDGSN